MNKKWLIPGLHLLAWTLLAISGVRDLMDKHAENPLAPNWTASPLPILATAICRTLAYEAVSIVAFYTAYSWVVPALFPKRRYGLAITALAAVCAAMVSTRAVMEFAVLKPLLHFENYFGRPVPIIWYITNCIGYSYNYCLFGIILSFLIRSGRMQQEKIAAELSFLRSQINPHFLFNTINDIYSLVYNQRKEAPEAILKLSGILRYTLYEEPGNNVSLEKELNYLHDYLELQRIGSNQRTFIDYHISGNPTTLQITPLLLIPFAENIIKHGVTDDPASPASLHIQINQKSFSLTAENYIKSRQKDPVKGIGLNNLRRRLELAYPGRYRLQTVQQEGKFRCTLDLTLNN